MLLHIIRHGQTDWNATRRIQGQLDSELDETGKQQASARSTDFATMPLRAVYSSSSLRTRQTTALILSNRPDTVIYRDELREISLGVWQGHYWPDIERDHPEQVDLLRNASAEFNVDGAETRQALQQRGVRAIETIVDEHNDAEPQDNILIVSHGAIMKTILAHYGEVDLPELQHLDELPNCAHCIIEVDGTERMIKSIAGEAYDKTRWPQFSRRPV